MKYPATPPSRSLISEILVDIQRNERDPAHKQAMVMLMYRCGLRVSEMLALTCADIFSNHILVRNGKGGKSRRVAMDDVVKQFIDPLMPCNGYLFSTRGGASVPPQRVREMCARIQGRLGCHRIAPHQFRHAHASELAREGCLPHLIQRQLGHSSLAVTDNYLRSIGDEHIDAIASRK